MAASCAQCGRALSDHKLGEWCRPGFTVPELSAFDRSNDRPSADVIPLPTTTNDRRPIRRKRMPRPVQTRRKLDHSSWLPAVSAQLGPSEPVECPQCHGAGKVTPTLSISDVQVILFPEHKGTAPTSTFAKRLHNPSLTDLWHIAGVLGDVPLDQAGEWCRGLAAKIRKAIEESA